MQTGFVWSCPTDALSLMRDFPFPMLVLDGPGICDALVLAIGFEVAIPNALSPWVWDIVFSVFRMSGLGICHGTQKF